MHLCNWEVSLLPVLPFKGKKIGDLCLRCGTIISLESPFQIRPHSGLFQGILAKCPTPPPWDHPMSSDDYSLHPLYMDWSEGDLREDDLVV